MDVTKQVEIDQKMIDLDGTENKSVLGANGILAVSMAVCRVSPSLSLEFHCIPMALLYVWSFRACCCCTPDTVLNAVGVSA